MTGSTTCCKTTQTDANCIICTSLPLLIIYIIYVWGCSMLHVYHHHAGYLKVYFPWVWSPCQWTVNRSDQLWDWRHSGNCPQRCWMLRKMGGAILVWYQMERLMFFACFCGYLVKGRALDRTEMIRLSDKGLFLFRNSRILLLPARYIVYKT